MAKRRNRVTPRQRSLTRPTRPRFVISTEGNTELQYFGMLNRLCRNVTLRGIKAGSQSAPRYVLKRMEDFIEKERGQNSADQYWLVTDKDSWNEQQLSELFNWSKSRENFGFSVSNPKFEYWLLLHFEHGHSVATSAEVTRRLKHYLPDYDKSIDPARFSLDRIAKAIERAKRHDAPPCHDWPRSPSVTTVYKLVESIVRNSEHSDILV